MFGIEIEFLTGKYTAQSGSYGSSEWPPHPSRFYSALVAAYHWRGFGKKERNALEWLEKQPAPDIYASEVYERETVQVFVPENDPRYVGKETRDRLGSREGGKLSASSILRVREEVRKSRTFPTVIPEDPVVYFVWRGVDSEEFENHKEGLENLVMSVPYLGHSSSLIRSDLVEDVPDPNYVPDESGKERVRVPMEGRLEELERFYESGRRPEPITPLRYGESTVEETVEISMSDWSSDLLILKISNKVRPPLELTLDLTSRVRDAMIAAAEEPVPEYISGHTQEGDPTEREHVVYFPLCNVSYKWSDGAIHGLALAYPDSLTDDERSKVLRTVGELDRIGLGPRGYVELYPTGIPKKTSLETDPYIGPSKVWITVTPYIFDRFPTATEGEEEIIRKSCGFAGLPDPSEIQILESGVNPLVGVPNDSDFQIPSERFGNKPWKHLILRFESPVEGPIILGSGRYYGLGLMRSWEALEKS